MEILQFQFPASATVKRRAHVGVVGSGDLEVLLEPLAKDDKSNENSMARVRVRTSVKGFSHQWEAVLQRFFLQNGRAVSIEINDAGATPGVVSLRLAQAIEAADQ